MNDETQVKFKLQGQIQKNVLTIADVRDYLETWAMEGDRVELEILGDDEEV